MYSDQTFIEHFRLSKVIANQLAEQYAENEDFTKQTGPYGKLTAYHQVSIKMIYVL